MIVYNLKCRKDHGFEAWFRDSAAFDRQAAAGTLACPTCGNRKIEKALMAPRLGTGAARETAPPANVKAVMETEKSGDTMKTLAELRRKIEENFDYVGPGFAEEARKIHYGETDPRGIYGESTDEQARALREEGVSFGRVPWAPRQNS